jgi:hypothetical protein
MLVPLSCSAISRGASVAHASIAAGRFCVGLFSLNKYLDKI